MTKFSKTLFSTLLLVLNLHVLSSLSHANDLSIANVVLTDRSPSSDAVVIEFDLAWENAWKTKINHDAVWLTVRLNDSASPTDKRLCQLTTAGVNPTGIDLGSSSAIEAYVPADKLGVFIRPDSFTTQAAISTTAMSVTVDY